MYGGPEVQHRILMKHQIQITNIKFKFVASNLNSSHQIQIHHIKFKFVASNLNSSHQIQIHHIKFKFTTSNSNSSHQIQIHHIKYSNSSHQMYGQPYIIYFLMNFMIAALTLTSRIMAVFTTTEHELTQELTSIDREWFNVIVILWKCFVDHVERVFHKKHDFVGNVEMVSFFLYFNLIYSQYYLYN
jgi:hypothetical protein